MAFSKQSLQLSVNHPVLICALLAIALGLRLYGLNAGLWHDEIATYINYGGLSFGEILTVYDSQNQHMLYSLIARISLLVFGVDAWALRLPAVLFGVASIGVLYILVRQVGSAREAIFSSALMTFSYHHIWFSQNARGYTGLLFFTLLASVFLIRAIREGRTLLWVAYSITAALGIYMQMTMVFVIAGHFVIFLLASFRKRTLWRGFLPGFVLTGLVALLLYAPVLPQIFADFTARQETNAFTEWQNPIWTLLEVIRAVEIGFAGGVVVVAGCMILGVGVWHWFRRDPTVVYLLFIPTTLCAAVAIGTGHNLWPRLFFFAMGFGVLVVISGIIVIGEEVGSRVFRSPRNIFWSGQLAVLVLIGLSALSIPYVYGPKQDYEGALTFVEEARNPSDVIVTTGMAAFTFREYFDRNWPFIETGKALDEVRLTAPRTWVLYSFPPHLEALYPEVLARIERDFSLVRQFPGTLNGGDVYVYLSKRTTQAAIQTDPVTGSKFE